MKVQRVTVIMAITLMAALTGCSASCAETQYQQGGSAPAIPQAEKLQILSHSMGTTDYGTPVVRGTAKNVSSSNLSYAEVRVKFYDAAGNLLDTSLDNVLDLGPGETWNFEVIYFGSGNVKNYEIGVGSTF